MESVMGRGNHCGSRVVVGSKEGGTTIVGVGRHRGSGRLDLVVVFKKGG